jgi:hypothetical protein
MTGPPLRFDAAEKRLVRARADVAGGGGSDPHDREQSGRQRAARSIGGESLPPPQKTLPSRFFHFRRSRREQSLGRSHTVAVLGESVGGSPGA